MMIITSHYNALHTARRECALKTHSAAIVCPESHGSEGTVIIVIITLHYIALHTDNQDCVLKRTARRECVLNHAAQRELP